MPLEYKATYYPWITQHIDAKEIRSNIETLFRIVASELGTIINDVVKIEVQNALEVPQQIESIVKGDCHIALMNPLGFVFANEMNKQVQVISIVEREIKGKWGLTYFAQIYTSKRTAIRPPANGNTGDLKKQLKKKSIGFGTAISTSNFLIPAYELYKIGLHPLNTFLKTEFIGGHDTVAKAVYEGKIDVGCGHDGVIKDLAGQYGYGDAEEKLITLIQSEPITSDPVAVNISDTKEFGNLQIAMEKASRSKDGLKAIQTFWGKGRYLLPPTPETTYTNLNTAKDTLNIKAEHILG